MFVLAIPSTHQEQDGNQPYMSYRDVATVADIKLDPAMGLHVDEPGTYLVHSEHNGGGHCVLIVVDDERATLFDRNISRRCAVAEMKESSSSI